jgi:FAD-linked oxidoreductase
MKNWSGVINSSPELLSFPRSEEEILRLVGRAREGRKRIRVVGSGHSFTPLWDKTEILVSLDRYTGIVSVDRGERRVRVRAGTKLSELNELLHSMGLALENLGDIDQQSIAGAISTGTHGTGATLGSISTQLRGLRFVNGRSEVLECSFEENPELFRMAQVSLGALGIILEVELQCVEASVLELRVEREALRDMLCASTSLREQNRHFEFFWFPHTPYVMSKRINPTDQAAEQTNSLRALGETALENYVFYALCQASRLWPAATAGISRFAGRASGSRRKIDYSHRVFSTSRLVKFNEMEYSVPIEAYEQTMRELVNRVNTRYSNVLFPVENRFVASDDIPLSPSFGRDSAYIAVHLYHKKDFRAFFADIEAIFRAHDGRPHWGKIHSCAAPELGELYPEFGAFRKTRSQQDPEGLFLTDYLKELLGG